MNMINALMVFDGILSIALIAVVILQPGKSAGLSGSIGGGAETLLGGRKRGIEEHLARATIVLAALFGIVTLVVVKLTS
jgi:preprotein translocase subunit SecG